MGKKTRLPCGCKCDWHQAQLARRKAERPSRRSEGGTRSVCSTATQPLDAFTLQLNLDRILKIPSQSCVGFEEVVTPPIIPLLSSLERVSVSESQRTCARQPPRKQKNWHTRVWHTPRTSFPQCPLLFPPLLMPPPRPILIPSSSGALPQRTPLNHMCHCRACSCSGANCSLVNCMLVGGGLPLHPDTVATKRDGGSGGSRAVGGWGVTAQITISPCSLFLAAQV